MRQAALALVLGGLALAGGAAAQDLEAGRKVAAMCRTCHGLDGMPRIPNGANIGGQPVDYLQAQLEAFRSGQRTNEMMTIVAASLSDAQIADVAAWYAAHKITATIDADPANAPSPCADCHGADGISVVEDTPNLAGETKIYLEQQLDDFRAGKRASDIMGPIAQDLSDDAIRAAADWYSAARIKVSAPE